MPLDLAHFVTLDRFDDMDRVGAEVSHFVRVDEDAQLDAWRADVHAQFIDDASGVGGYAVAPGARVESHDRVGDVEVGLLYRPELASDAVTAVLHAGLGLPTSRDHSPPLQQAALARLADTALTLPGTGSARVGGSLIWQDGQVFARGDLAVDANLESAGDSIGRGGVGVGIIAGSAALMGEVNVVGGGPYDPVASTGAFAVRIDADMVQVYGAFEFGLDGTTRNTMKDAFILGADFPL